MTHVHAPMPAITATPIESPESVRDQYLDARSTDSWKPSAGVTGGLVGSAAAMGAVLLVNAQFPAFRQVPLAPLVGGILLTGAAVGLMYSASRRD